jgi:hypothetical protein
MVVWKLSAGSGKQDACHVIVVCDGLVFACLQGKQDARMEERRLTDPLMTNEGGGGEPHETLLLMMEPLHRGKDYVCLSCWWLIQIDRYYDLRARDSRFVNVVF